jgi:hypothetical protein
VSDVRLDRAALARIAATTWPSWASVDRYAAIGAVRDVLAGRATGRVVTAQEAAKIFRLAHELHDRVPPSRRVRELHSSVERSSFGALLDALDEGGRP